MKTENERLRELVWKLMSVYAESRGLHPVWANTDLTGVDCADATKIAREEYEKVRKKD